jgi:hypothetical protein
LGHDAADGRALFRQDDPVAGVGQVQGGLNAGDAAADDKDGADGWCISYSYSSSVVEHKRHLLARAGVLAWPEILDGALLRLSVPLTLCGLGLNQNLPFVIDHW